jgi:hypothetical protein
MEIPDDILSLIREYTPLKYYILFAPKESIQWLLHCIPIKQELLNVCQYHKEFHSYNFEYKYKNDKLYVQKNIYNLIVNRYINCSFCINKQASCVKK